MTINQQASPRGLIIRMTAMFALVVLFSAIAIWVGTDVSSKVASKAENLVTSHVPELRVISNLLHDMNQQIIELHKNYAEATETDYTQYEQLRSRFTANLTELNRLSKASLDIFIIQQSLDEFDQSLRDFNAEMKLGASRDWDLLRDHLALAQSASNKVISTLSSWNQQIQSRSEYGGSMTLYEIKRLTHLQTGFILAVLGVSLIILLAYYSRYKALQKIYHQAYFDDLTDLPNRKSLEDSWHDRAHGANKAVDIDALLLIRLDSFQTVTGIHGYIAGDQLLISVSSWIKHRLKQHDERNVLYQYAPGVWLALIQTRDSHMTAENVADDLLALSAAPRKIKNRELYISCSIGIAEYTSDATSLDELIRNADKALRTARQLGGNNARLFHKDMNIQAESRLATETAIKNAIRESSFELHFQPKVSVNDGSITGAEALIRWHDKDKLVPPGQFIPIAEQSALIIDIGDWVLTEACRQWVAWQKDNKLEIHIAVNISAQQFQMPNFPEKVEKILQETGMPPQFLELEITEEVAAGNLHKVADIMSELKAVGVSLAIDDFGTGYSSLSNLKRFPLDTIKIDKMFVQQMETSSQDMAIAQMIHTLAKQLELKIVAEGVETDAQQEILKKMGSDYLQGFYFGRPICAADFIGLLSTNKPQSVTTH